MLFSVILPTYKVSAYIDRCVQSLQKQTYKHFEMVFVDDCGDDGSLDIVKRYAQADQRIRIIKNKNNVGTYHARRVGVENSMGKYVVFVDPDDEIEINLLRKLAETINKNPSVEMVFYDVEYVPKKKIYQGNRPSLPKYDSGRILEGIYSNWTKRTVAHGILGKVYNSCFLKDVYSILDVDKNFKYTFSEDQLVYYAALFKNPSYRRLKHQGYRYHIHDDSISSKSRLAEPQLLVRQQIYTYEKLSALSTKLQHNFTLKEKKIVSFLLNREMRSQIYLLQRFENGGRSYLYFVWNAFKIRKEIRSFLRIVVYLLTFARIKL